MADEGSSPDWKGYGADQVTIEQWIRRTFGDASFESKHERALRVVEESVELFQSVVDPKQDGKTLCHKLIDAVFARPAGKTAQEIAGVGVTLVAVCACEGVRLDTVMDAEIARLHTTSREKFRTRQREKADLGISMRPE